MPNALISILTPFKNSKQYLYECVRSVLEQSYRHWELIAINDHSTDNSLALMQDFASTDSRIVVQDNSGDGIIDALRQAFYISKGNYITRMDSDDIMHKSKLAIMLEQIETSGQGHIALGQVKYVSNSGVSPLYMEYQDWLNKLTSDGSNFEERYKECSIPSPCWMVHRSDLVKAGAFDSSFYPEDYDLMFRFYRLGLKILPSKHELHYWRDYEHRTSKQSPNYAVDRFTELKAYYFYSDDYDPKRPLAVLGAGSKSKLIVQFLRSRNVMVNWITIHPNKSGTNVQGINLGDWDDFLHLNHPKIIVTFKNKVQQAKVIKIFKEKGLIVNQDYFMFC